MKEITISIPEDLKQKLEEKLKETNFESVEDYILYVLNQMVSEGEEVATSDNQPYTDDEEVDLKERLKELGYL